MPLDQDSFVEHLGHTYGLDPRVAARVCAECAAYWNQDLETWIRQRHLELQQSGRSNTEIYRQLARETRERPFAAGQLTERQIRRKIYG